MDSGWDHADGVLCSATVPRHGLGPGSSLMSLRRAHHRRDPGARSLIGQHDAAFPGTRAPGGSRSEIEEEAAGRGTFAEGITRCPRPYPSLEFHALRVARTIADR